MRKILISLLAAAVLTSVPATAQSPRAERGEAKLEKLLQGRVAGDPTNCITLRPGHSSRIIPGTAIVYEGPGNTLYVNRPHSGAESLSPFDVLVTRPFSNRLCRVDSVRLFDPASRMQTGVVFLGDFVPYRKVRDGREG